MIRTLVVDDEEPARERLRQLLTPYEQIEVVGEAGDGEEAMQAIHRLQPDLVFLDIQMPGCSGMEVAASLASPTPHIIFCTAYDQYAVDAFELNAVDYLLKPVSRTRLRRAVEKLGEMSSSQTQIPPGTAPPTRFLGRRGNKFRVVHQREVLYFASEEGLTKLCTASLECWMQPSLNELEKRLDSKKFYRISRSCIVNLDAVKEVVPLIGGYGAVVVRNGQKLDVSRRRYKNLLAALDSR